MADYIDKQKTLTAIFEIAENVIKSLPSADVQPVRHGKWAEEIGVIYCPFCGDPWSVHDERMVKSFNYCPNCGARMDGEQNETD